MRHREAVTLCSGQELLIDEDVQGHLWSSHEVLEKIIIWVRVKIDHFGTGNQNWLMMVNLMVNDG